MPGVVPTEYVLQFPAFAEVLQWFRESGKIQEQVLLTIPGLDVARGRRPAASRVLW